jgi:hypothetical protein
MKKIREIDLTNLIRPYAKENLWIALNTEQDKVIATGKTLKEAIYNAKKVSNEKPVLMQAVQDYSAYILGY